MEGFERGTQGFYPVVLRSFSGGQCKENEELVIDFSKNKVTVPFSNIYA